MTVEDGWYNGTILSTNLTKSKSGTPGINFGIGLTSHADFPDKPVTAKVWSTLWLSEAAIENAIDKIYNDFKWQGVNVEELDGTQDLVDMDVSVLLEHEEYEGKNNQKVAWFGPPRNAAEPMTDSEKATFTGRVNEAFARFRAKNNIAVKAAAPKAEPAQPSTSVADDDLPF